MSAKPHNSPREQQCDSRGKAGAGLGKGVHGIVHDTEHQLFSGGKDIRRYCPRAGAVHISDTGAIHLGFPNTLSLFQPIWIRTLAIQRTQHSGV
jgi:hypothetical protein